MLAGVFLAPLLASLAFPAPQLGGRPDPNRLATLEQCAGWRLLFAGVIAGLGLDRAGEREPQDSRQGQAVRGSGAGARHGGER